MPERNNLRHRTRRGTAAVEYAVVLALIVVVCIANLRLLGFNSFRIFRATNDVLGPPANVQAPP